MSDIDVGIYGYIAVVFPVRNCCVRSISDDAYNYQPIVEQRTSLNHRRQNSVVINETALGDSIIQYSNNNLVWLRFKTEIQR